MRRKDIVQDLRETRERGYAINRGEFRPGVCGIAVPVRDRSGGVIASIGIWGAEANILGSRREELAHLAMIAARDISRDLGYLEPAAAIAAKRTPEEVVA
jgi:DNA-binding IclR family transcriptional regulator